MAAMASGINVVDLEDRLGDIETDCRNRNGNPSSCPLW
jgi:hypothetical protein